MHLPFNWFKWTQASHNESILCNPKPASLLALAQAILIPPLLDTCVCHTHKTKKKKKKKRKRRKKERLKLCSRSYTTFFGKMKLTIKWKAYGLLVCTKPLIDSLSWPQLFTRKAGYVYQLDPSMMLAQRYKCHFFFPLFFVFFFSRYLSTLTIKCLISSTLVLICKIMLESCLPIQILLPVQ